MPWCLPLSRPVIPRQPARVICNNPASNSQSQKPLMKCNSRQRLREVFHFQVGCLCSDKSLQSKQNLTETYCEWLVVEWCTTSAASSTFIYSFYYDLMHSLIPSTSVTPSEESLLLLISYFLWIFTELFCSVILCFTFLKELINFVSENRNKKKPASQLMLCMTFLPKPAGELFCFYH